MPDARVGLLYVQRTRLGPAAAPGGSAVGIVWDSYGGRGGEPHWHGMTWHPAKARVRATYGEAEPLPAAADPNSKDKTRQNDASHHCGWADGSWIMDGSWMDGLDPGPLPWILAGRPRPAHASSSPTATATTTTDALVTMDLAARQAHTRTNHARYGDCRRGRTTYTPLTTTAAHAHSLLLGDLPTTTLHELCTSTDPHGHPSPPLLFFLFPSSSPSSILSFFAEKTFASSPLSLSLPSFTNQVSVTLYIHFPTVAF